MLARQIAIGFGIAIIFPLLVYYGVSTFHSPPRYSDYVTTIDSLGPNATAEEKKQRAEKQRLGQQAYDRAMQAFSRTLIIIATPLGVAAILIGTFIPLHSVGTGLILGGIATVATGYTIYWDQLTDALRFISLLIGLVVLIFVGYRQFSAARTKASAP